MKKVYRVRRLNDTQYFLPENRHDSKHFRLICTPKQEEWEPISVYNRMPLLKETDFLNYSEGYLIASPRALELIGYFFESAGEILPLYYDGRTYGVINILNCVNCLNRKQTIWTGAAKSRIDKPEFHVSRLPYPGLFKIPENAGTTIYVYVNSYYSTTDDFKYQVEKHGLKGLWFDKMWESED